MRYLQKNNLYSSVIIAIAVLKSFGADQLYAQQSNMPPGIGTADTTMIARLDASVIDSVLIELPNWGKEDQETVLESQLRQTKEIIGEEKVWLSADWPRVPTKVTLHVADTDGTRVKRLSELWNFKDGELKVSRQWTISLRSVTGTAEQTKSPQDNEWQNLIANTPKDAAKAPATIAIKPPKHLYETLNESLTELPNYLGGGPVSLLTEGALSATIAVDPETRLIEGFIQSKNGEAATKLKDHLAKLFALASDSPPEVGDESMTSLLQAMAQQTSVSAEQDRVRVRFTPQDDAAGDALTRQAVEAIIGPVAQQSQLKNLRTAGLGILNFESAFSYFPPPAKDRDADGKTKLSWRVHILPFLGQEGLGLYKKFKLDEPWDSPANIKLLPEMPVVYSPFSSQLMMPADGPKGMTTIVAPISDNTVLGAPQKVGFGSITDGSSNTVLLVIVKDSLAVPWTAPQDYTFDRDDPAAGLKFDKGKTPGVRCDGSTYLADEDNQWLLLFEMNDGGIAEVR